MKKILFGIVVLILAVSGIGYAWYKSSYGGEAYYLQVTTDGKEIEVISDSGIKFKEFNYKINSYQKDGKEKMIAFTADHNLRKSAYLRATFNSTKGVTSWEEIKKSNIPKAALKKINGTT